MVSWNLLNTDVRNGLLHDGTKTLPEPTLTYHQRSVVAFTRGLFDKKYPRYQSTQWKITHCNSQPYSSSGQWVNSLKPSEAIWRHRTGSTLVQAMACCLTAPSHYLNQCWLIISEVLWHSPDSNFTENASDIYRWNDFEIYWFETVVKSPRGQWVNLVNRLLHQDAYHHLTLLSWYPDTGLHTINRHPSHCKTHVFI